MTMNTERREFIAGVGAAAASTAVYAQRLIGSIRRECLDHTVVFGERHLRHRQMSGANPLWGAPRIHGELLKLGIDVGQTSVAKYLVRRRVPPSQGWRTFLRNHADGIAAMDLFVVPTISFRPLYGLLIMGAWPAATSVVR